MSIRLEAFGGPSLLGWRLSLLGGAYLFFLIVFASSDSSIFFLPLSTEFCTQKTNPNTNSCFAPQKGSSSQPRRLRHVPAWLVAPATRLTLMYTVIYTRCMGQCLNLLHSFRVATPLQSNLPLISSPPPSFPFSPLLPLSAKLLKTCFHQGSLLGLFRNKSPEVCRGNQGAQQTAEPCRFSCVTMRALGWNRRLTFPQHLQREHQQKPCPTAAM